MRTPVLRALTQALRFFPPRLLALAAENVLYKLGTSCLLSFNKAYLKITVALDRMVVLHQLIEKTIAGAVVVTNLTVPCDFSCRVPDAYHWLFTSVEIHY